MRAIVFHTFGGPLSIEEIADPSPPADGVVLRVTANGICRSDWHAWQGHDPDIVVPHVPGHELAGEIVAVGRDVTRWHIGDRVTVPFVLGCGTCALCRHGQPQVCEHQYQPGFTGLGSMAEYVSLPRADGNLVALPHDLDDADAASLGCRFATSYRAVVQQARVQPGQWLAVPGCGGVGLSAVMIGAALGARVMAIDIHPEALAMARRCGAEHLIDSRTTDPVRAVVELSSGGADVSIDAVGITETCVASIRSLRTHGRHVQVGLMLGAHTMPEVPIGLLHSREIELYGAHGMAAHSYPEMLSMVANGQLRPHELVTERMTLSAGLAHLGSMADYPGHGMAVITDLTG